jgi:protein-S-isoprenylcysteine O-methyltransferase Ste14
MSDDELFRLILLAGFVILMPIGIYHRLKARTGEKLDRRQEGLFILVTLRLAGVAGIAGLIAYLINPACMAWAAVSLPVWLRWTGVGLGLIAGLLLVWTFRSLGKNLTDTVVTRKEHRLVTTGPYRWVRHPFYTSVAFAVLANSLAAANWFLFVTGSLVFVLQAIRTRKEDENLIARFGDDYRNYMQRTGRFVPRL